MKAYDKMTVNLVADRHSTTIMSQRMRDYEFSLFMTGTEFFTDEELDLLYESGCDDGSPSMSGGILQIDFCREAETLDEAVVSAIETVSRAGLPQKVTKVVKQIHSSAIKRALQNAHRLSLE